jgi:hypothetical protein
MNASEQPCTRPGDAAAQADGKHLQMVRLQITTDLTARRLGCYIDIVPEVYLATVRASRSASTDACAAFLCL